MATRGEIKVGVSGWAYRHWRKGAFYPDGLPQRREIEFVGSRMNSAEVNGSFYGLLRPASYQQWHGQTPEGFVFAIKGSRYITHMKKLRGVETPLANFFASGVLCLREKLGPVLWQLPPNLGFDADRLAAFFDLLPRTTVEAAALAKKHDERLNDRAWTEADADRPIRHALEFRHDSYKTPAMVKLLRRHRVALCVADTAGKFPYLEDVTADFVYVRLHGAEHLYASGYSDPQLDGWRGASKRGAPAASRRTRCWPRRTPRRHGVSGATCTSTSITTPTSTPPTTRSIWRKSWASDRPTTRCACGRRGRGGAARVVARRAPIGAAPTEMTYRGTRR